MLADIFTQSHPHKSTSAKLFSSKFAIYFQNTFLEEHIWRSVFAFVSE